MKIWVAAIDCKDGTGLYAAATEDGLYAQLAAYCTQEWRDAFPGEDIPPHDINDAGIVSTYFDAMGNGGDEWHTVEDVDIADPLSEPSDQVGAIAIVAKQKYAENPDIDVEQDNPRVRQEQNGCWVAAWVWAENVYIEPRGEA